MIIYPSDVMVGVNSHLKSTITFCKELIEPFKARSHDPISRIRFLVPKIGLKRSDDPISGFCFCGRLLIYQEECRIKIEHVLFPSVFQNQGPCLGRSLLLCSHDPIFGTNKNRILEIGSCERALDDLFPAYCQFHPTLSKNTNRIKTRRETK